MRTFGEASQLPAAFPPGIISLKILYSYILHPIFSHLLIRDANVDK